MNKTSIACAVAVAAGIAWAALPIRSEQGSGAQSTEKMEGQSAIQAHEMQVTGKVTKVATDKKQVTIKNGGKSVTLEVPENVYDLATLKKGSTLNVRYLEALALSVTKPGMPAEAAAPGESVRLAPPGGEEVVVNSKEITGVVQNINHESRELTLKSREHGRLTIKASDSVTNLDEIKKGDTAVVRFTDAVALSASPTGMPETTGSSSETPDSSMPESGNESGSQSPSGTDSQNQPPQYRQNH